MNEQRDFGREFGLNPDVRILTLNDTELELLRRQDPSTEQDGGYQQLLVTLQGEIEEGTNKIFLTRPVRARIRRYAFQYRQGGWQGRLVGIFSRHLGPDLDGNI
jgi:hypothetical protein